MRLVPIPGKELIRILETLGFAQIRQRGSHVYMRHPDGRTTVVPVHSGRDVGRGLLRRILNDVDLSREEFIKLR